MNAHTYKTNPPTGSTIDSFEANFNQIEHTNRLLANIETKLNNFFHKNVAPSGSPSHPSSAQNHHPRTQAYQEQQQIITEPSPHRGREDFIHDIGNTMLSPIQNKDSVQHFMSGGEDHPLRPANKYINIIDPSQAYTSNHSHTEGDTSSNVYMTQSRIVNERYLNTDDNQTQSPSALHTSPQGYRFSDSNTHEIPRIDPYRVGSYQERVTMNGKNSERVGSEERIDRGDRRFYEKKIKILEERLSNSEKEINNLIKLKGGLNSEVIRLKVQLSESQNRYVDDLNKSLRSQEERLRREFDEHYQYRDNDPHENIKYLEKIDIITSEKGKLQQELADLQKQYERVWEEKDRVAGQYNNLLTAHNQMLQIDIHKNEKSLKSSQGERSNEGRVSVARSHDGRIAPEQLKMLVESLTLYKQELDALKENNVMIKVQFEEEINTLREELDVQREQNTKLLDKLRAQTQTLVKLQSPQLQKSASKDMIGRSSTAPMVVTDFSDEHYTPNKRVFKQTRDKSRASSNREVEESRTKYQMNSVNTGAHSHEGPRRSSRRYDRDGSTGKKSSGRRSERYERQLEDMKGRSSEKDTGRFNKDEVPFTNAEIKSGMLSREGKGTARELLYRELAELHATPPKALTAREAVQVKNKSKSRSKSKSQSKSKRKISDDEVYKTKGKGRPSHEQKSPGTAYEEFEEELKKLKGVLRNKGDLNKGKERERRSNKENTDRMSRRKSNERLIKKDRLDKRLSATSRPTVKQTSSMSKDSKTGSGTARGKTGRKPFY